MKAPLTRSLQKNHRNVWRDIKSGSNPQRHMKTLSSRRVLATRTAVGLGLAVITVLVAQPSKPIAAATNEKTSAGETQQTNKKEEKNDMKGANDFDFLSGDWHVHHRSLKDRLANSHEWIEFDGTCTSRKILGGLGNMDENVLNRPDRTYFAVTVRTYDPAKEQWSIWWIDSRYAGPLDPPVVGRFENGVGTFYADDNFKGKPIRVRFLWTQLSSTPHWEQAFSSDGGKTWETNWTMDFTRKL
jgi:hypothetical protein